MIANPSPFRPTPIEGQEAFELTLKVLFGPTDNNAWVKTGHSDFHYIKFDEQGLPVYIRATKGGKENRHPVGPRIGDVFGYLQSIATSQDGGVFFIPAKPGRLPLKAYCPESDVLSAEMDDGTSEEQWERLAWFREISGLDFAAVVHSGSKSYHAHIKLNRKIPIEERTQLQKQMALILRSDPAVVNPHQPMRLPGFVRREKNRPQRLVYHSETQHTAEEVRSGFRRIFEALGWEFHAELSDERWRELRRLVVNKPVPFTLPITLGLIRSVPFAAVALAIVPENLEHILANPGQNIKPITALLRGIHTPHKPKLTDNQKLARLGEILARNEQDFQFVPAVQKDITDPTGENQKGFNSPLRFSGATPLEKFLPKELYSVWETGCAKGGAGREPHLYKLCVELRAIVRECDRLGIRYQGDPVDLLYHYAYRCSPSADIVALVEERWQRCTDAAFHVNEDYIRQKQQSYFLELWRASGSPKGKDWIDWATRNGVEGEVSFETQTSSKGFLWNALQTLKSLGARNRQISKQDWWEKFRLPRQEGNAESFLLNQIEKLFRFGKNRLAKAGQKAAKQTVKALLTVPPETDPNAIEYCPGAIPDLIEWWRRGEPTVRFSDGNQIKTLIPEIKRKGYKFAHDGSYCGSGKTHTYGNLSCLDLGMKEFARNEEEKKELGRIIWISENPRNPATLSVEERYIAPEVKHGGLIEDTTRRTPGGRNHLKRSTQIEHDENSLVELAEYPSCIHWATFQAGAERSYILRAGQNSPVCQTCERFKICPLINSEPEEYRYLSYHPEALKTPRGNDVSFGDEARNLFKDTQNYTAQRSDIERALTHIERKAKAAGDEKTPQLVKSFIHSLLDGMDEFTPERRHHGVAHRESVEKVIFNPLIGEAVEVMATVLPNTPGAIPVEDYWADSVEEGIVVCWIKTSEVSPVKEKIQLTCGSTIWVDSFNLRNQIALTAFEDQIWELYGDDWLNLQDKTSEHFYIDELYTQEVVETVSTNVWGTVKRFVTTNRDGKVSKNRKEQYFAVVPSIKDVQSQLNHYLHSRDEKLFNEHQSPTEKYQSVTSKVFYNWLNPCLDMLTGNHRASFRIYGDTLTVSRSSSQQSSIVKNQAFHVSLDATVDKRDLEDLLNLKSVDGLLKNLDEDLRISQQILLGLPPDLELTHVLEARIERVSEEMESLIRENKIISVEQTRPDNSNAKLVVYSNLGRVTRDRFCRDKKTGKFNTGSRYALGNRVKALTTDVIDLALSQGKKVGILDIKAMIQGVQLDLETFSPYEKYRDNPNVVMGWFFNDHVGTNRFEDVDLLIIVGRPQINLGQLAAEFQCRTGQIVDPAHPTGEFAAYVERVTLGELEQAIARPRIHRRPDKQIEIHLIDEYGPGEIAHLQKKFPGIGVDFKQTEDVCLDAATKGVQLATRFDATIKTLIELGDIAKATAARIGESLGVTHGRISQLVKERWNMGFRDFKRLLIFLLNIPNRKTNEFSLASDELWIANFYLPQIVKDWQSGHTSESEMVDDMVNVAQSFTLEVFERILDESPPLVVAQLVRSFLSQLPAGVLEKIPIPPAPS